MSKQFRFRRIYWGLAETSAGDGNGAGGGAGAGALLDCASAFTAKEHNEAMSKAILFNDLSNERFGCR